MTAVAVAPSPCYPADNIADVLLSAEHLASLTDGTLEGSGARRSPLRGVVTDSREATEGCAFIALPGAITDGHRYVGDAARRGAALAIVAASWPATQPSPPLLLRVDDTAAALRRACSRRLAELGCVVLGITGSVGKTTFKEMCALVLPGGAHRLRVGKTVGNLNTWTGIPLSVLRLEEPVDVFVAELAMSARGEIADLCSFTHPRVGAVLNVGLAHVGLLGSREAIAEAKAELVEALPPDGEAVWNADDEWVERIVQRTRAHRTSFGMRNQSAAFRVCDVLVEEMARTSFTLVTPEGQRRTCIPAAGEHLALNAAGVAAVASVLGVGLDQVAERLGALTLPDGRGRTYAAVNGAVLYDDTYNSSPTSLSAALDVLAASGAAERVAVLGDMLELGAAAPEQHVRAGQLAAAKATSLVAVGEYATTIRDAAVNAGLPPARARVAGDAEEAAREAAALCRPGAVVLVKASRAVALDEVVRRLRDGT